MSSTRLCPQAHLLRGAAVGAAVDSDRHRSEVRQRPLQRCQDGHAQTHLHTLRDPDTHTETDAQTQDNHRATKPEKDTH